MKFISGQIYEHTFIGLIQGDKVLDIHKAESILFELATLPPTLLECIEIGERFVTHVMQLVEWSKKAEDTESYLYPLENVKILAPITKLKKNIFCVAKNYYDHAEEMGDKENIDEHIMLFSKAPTTVIGPEEEIDPHLHLTNELDYEGELAIVIGKKGKQIEKEDAMDYVFGYTIVNDITARDLQSRHKQFFLGKSLDTSCPMGPYIVHKSAINDPKNLMIKTSVNNEVRQDGNTKEMIFPIEYIISIISQGTTLEAGDIIATGTPAGVGKGFHPPKYLQPGDVIEIEIEEIGVLRNKVKK
ncbi:fumarylacetoacetate hydrolase family protein [Metabacillus fastidiosus]|uniref:fumarylacetoacetate hydrolase family protein n=1 Tax=Metabacillus fastidiosus TaxID=1458 RepID=UPI003D2AECD5